MAGYLDDLLVKFLDSPNLFVDVKAIVDAPIVVSANELLDLLKKKTAEQLLAYMAQPGDDLLIPQLDLSNHIYGLHDFLKEFDNEEDGNNSDRETEDVEICRGIKINKPGSQSFLSINVNDYVQFDNAKWARRNTIANMRTTPKKIYNDDISFHDELLAGSTSHKPAKLAKVSSLFYDLTKTMIELNHFLNLENDQSRGLDAIKDDESHDKVVDKTVLLDDLYSKYIILTEETKQLILQNYHKRIGRFGCELIQIWPKLFRAANSKFDPDTQTLIRLPKPFIVPGGRFIEIYYWDSYWIILGLIASNLTELASYLLENFLYIVQRFSFIPNGSRSYYLDRSQPPLLSSMARVYYYATKDIVFLNYSLPILEKEYMYWMNPLNGHIVELQDDQGETHVLNRYYSSSSTPRPESHRLDVKLCEELVKRKNATDADCKKFYRSIRAGAESGWDFSSRWLRPSVEKGTDDAIYRGNSSDASISSLCLIDIDTTNIIPCDLNAFLYNTERDLEFFYRLLGNNFMANSYAQKAEQRRRSMFMFNWDCDKRRWMDYDRVNRRLSKVLSAASFVPLWARLNPNIESSEERLALVKPLAALVRPYGIVSTTIRAGLQWDSPNVWAPLHHMATDFLCGGRFWEYDEENKIQPDDPSFKLAANWASRFINTALYRFEKHGVCSEKYYCKILGKSGLDGEYFTQEGFGWTNGTLLDFMYKFRKSLTPQGLYGEIIKLEK